MSGMKFCGCADRVEQGLRGGASIEEDPHDGTCCKCGYNQEDETPCPYGDGSHCVHWWDGVPDN